MQNLSLEEQETVIQQNAANRNTWHISTDDAVMQRRLERLGITPTYTSNDGQYKEYDVGTDQIFIRKGKRVLSPKQQEAAAERARAMRAKRKT
jgi:hypothetical protein